MAGLIREAPENFSRGVAAFKHLFELWKGNAKIHIAQRVLIALRTNDTGLP